jgi:hypothetical protein
MLTEAAPGLLCCRLCQLRQRPWALPAEDGRRRRPPAGPALIHVTMDRYGHLFPDALEQLADRLDAAHAAARTDPTRTEPQHEVVEPSAGQARTRA